MEQDASPFQSVVFSIRAGDTTLSAKLDLSADETWIELSQGLSDREGPTSCFVWIASRKVSIDPPIWECEYEIGAGAADPRRAPDRPATTVFVDSIAISWPSEAPAIAWQSSLSSGATLAGPFVLLAHHSICGRFAIGPVKEMHSLEELAAGWPAVNPSMLARYGPANWPLPIYDQTRQNAKWLGKRIALLSAMASHVTYDGEDGGDGIHAEALTVGWLRPYLDHLWYQSGGSGIDFLSGHEGLQHARYALLSHTLVAQRLRLAYNRERNYEPLSVDDWAGETPNYDMIDNELPSFQNVRYIGNVNEELLQATKSFRAPDPEHGSRALRKAMEAWEYFQSPLCARHVCATAEDYRLIFSERGPGGDGHGYVPRNLRTMNRWAANHQHEGGWIGRDIGWVAWAAAMLFKVRGMRVSRGWKNWARLVQQLLTNMAMPSGIQERVNAPPVWGPPEIDSCQAFEAPIIAWGAYALATQSGSTQGEWVFTAAVQLYRVCPQMPDRWIAGAHGPPHYVHVAEHGGNPLVQLTGGHGIADDGVSYDLVHPGDITHKEAACALQYRLTGDEAWFETASMTRDLEQTVGAYTARIAQSLYEASDQSFNAATAMILSEWQRALREGKIRARA